MPAHSMFFAMMQAVACNTRVHCCCICARTSEWVAWWRIHLCGVAVMHFCSLKICNNRMRKTFDDAPTSTRTHTHTRIQIIMGISPVRCCIRYRISQIANSIHNQHLIKIIRKLLSLNISQVEYASLCFPIYEWCVYLSYMRRWNVKCNAFADDERMAGSMRRLGPNQRGTTHSNCFLFIRQVTFSSHPDQYCNDMRGGERTNEGETNATLGDKIVFV